MRRQVRRSAAERRFRDVYSSAACECGFPKGKQLPPHSLTRCCGIFYCTSAALSTAGENTTSEQPVDLTEGAP